MREKLQRIVKKEKEEYMEEISFADKLPIWHFDGNILVFEDGSLGSGFVLEGRDIYPNDISSLNEFNLSLQNLLLSIKEGYEIQVFYRLTPNVGKMIQKHEDLTEAKNKTSEAVINSRLSFFRENERNGNYFVPEVYFFIKSPPMNYKRRGLFEGEKKFFQTSMEDYKKHKDGLLKERKKVENSLSSCGLKPKILSDKRWLELLFEYFNLERAEKTGVPRFIGDDFLFSDSLADQLILTDLGINREYLSIGNYHYKFISLYTLPDGITYAGMIKEILNLPFHFWISQRIVIHDQAKEIQKLKIQRRMANSFVQGAKKISDLESESKLFQIEELLRELLEGTDRIVSSSLCVIVWDKDKEKAEEKADSVLAAFRGMGQAEGVKESYGAVEDFLG